VISGWLVKIVLGIALIGFTIIELGSPLVARAQADDAAHQVADEASFQLPRTNTKKGLQEACETEAKTHSVTIVTCEINAKNEIAVTVAKHAHSFLLDKFSVTKDWYDVEASATAARR
jgi:Flp pilus assembly protein TadG